MKTVRRSGIVIIMTAEDISKKIMRGIAREKRKQFIWRDIY
jgi:hypothetical protein